MEEDKGDEDSVFDISSLDTYVVFALFVNILGSQAWRHMGLRIKPGTNEVEKDLERAKTAIDCIAFLVEKLEPHIPEDEKKSLRNLLADLQINFARIAES